jgi:hypothetical protein
MPVFPSAEAYQRFAQKAKSSRRFIRDAEDQEFFTALLQQARTDDRRQVLTPDFPLWRAQLGHCWKELYVDEAGTVGPAGTENQSIGCVPCPYSPERMKPLRGRARENRANPKGIPFLYLSNYKKTAMSEVRPWLGSLISLARFEPLRDLIIVHCWTDDEPPKYRLSTAPPYKHFRPEEQDRAVWHDIDEAFSEPVTRDDDLSSYATTQIVAELFRVHDFDGIAYRSAFGKGHNIALFDLDAVKLVERTLYKVDNITCKFKEEDS